MRLGLDQLPDLLRAKWRGARVGLVCHAASKTHDGTHAITLLTANGGWRLTTLFGPEHGVATAAQDMETVAFGNDPTIGVPVYSLYGDSPASLKPTSAMLANIDVVVIDLQDIGTRYYTYIWTMAYCLEACAQVGKPVIVCDRPNPINGVTVEGPMPQPGFQSFVGLYPLPVRHGMTIGELARYFNAVHRLDARLHILPMEGWRRDWYWDETNLAWINPSPNMRSITAALLYPGMCLLEATNVSEGRGTPTPFELCGAPWIDGEVLANKLHVLRLPGIDFAPIHFTPTARKYAGQSCGGLRFTITDRATFRPYEFGLALVHTLATIPVAMDDPKAFCWRDPTGTLPDDGPYEFVADRTAIDLLTGAPAVRTAIDRHVPWPLLRIYAGPTPSDFMAVRQPHLLY